MKVVLSRREISLVLQDLHRRRRYYNSRVNAIIFRLSCCCGLRRKEISGLELRDVITEGEQPCIRIRWQNTKKGLRRVRHKDGRIRWVKKEPRYVPLGLDTGTLNAIREWKAEQAERQGEGFWYEVYDHRGRPVGLFQTQEQAEGEKRRYFPKSPAVRRVTRLVTNKRDEPLTEEAISRRWRTAIKCLGTGKGSRVEQVSCHDGRRTFASVLMAAGAPTVNIKDMLGHENIQTTDNYLCSMDFQAQDLFGGA